MSLTRRSPICCCNFDVSMVVCGNTSSPKYIRVPSNSLQDDSSVALDFSSSYFLRSRDKFTCSIVTRYSQIDISIIYILTYISHPLSRNYPPTSVFPTSNSRPSPLRNSLMSVIFPTTSNSSITFATIILIPLSFWFIKNLIHSVHSGEPSVSHQPVFCP